MAFLLITGSAWKGLLSRAAFNKVDIPGTVKSSYRECAAG